MKCYIKGYNKDKWEADSEKIFQYDLEKVEYFEVVCGEEATGMQIAPKMRDSLHEYLIIHFEDGSQSVYCNSKVDLFKY